MNGHSIRTVYLCECVYVHSVLAKLLLLFLCSICMLVSLSTMKILVQMRVACVAYTSSTYLRWVYLYSIRHMRSFIVALRLK
jgi:hypothetical protein